MSHISDWLQGPCGWQAGGSLLRKLLLNLAVSTTTTPHLGIASQVRSRDSRGRRAWPGWGSIPQVTTGPHCPPYSQVLPREALFCSKWSPVNVAFEELGASTPFRLSGEPWDFQDQPQISKENNQAITLGLVGKSESGVCVCVCV